MRVINMIRRLRDEFTAMPGLRLTEAQVERLCTADASTSASALRALVSAGFLKPMPDGSYGRTDFIAGPPGDPPIGSSAPIVPSPWRRILCVVDVDSANALSAGARVALRYATTLAVTHRARVTACQILSQPSSEPALTSVSDALRKNLCDEPFCGLIDVHVTSGSANQEVSRVAKEINADLIVIGRSGRGDGEPSPRLSETLRQAPCPVLIVHPSGRAAVSAAHSSMQRRPWTRHENRCHGYRAHVWPPDQSLCRISDLLEPGSLQPRRPRRRGVVNVGQPN
jgi:nucleotide-binding universal stress UspA family protein